MRFSLRELLMLIALVAAAIVSLKYANEPWQIAVGMLTLVAFMGALIGAVVDRGGRQAFALGMVLAMTVYGALIASREMTTTAPNGPLWGGGKLPTTQLLNYLLIGVQETRLFDRTSGEEIRDDHPLARWPVQVAVRRRVPHRNHFMSVGHCWWALLLGYAGGRFAAYVYARRTRDSDPLAAASS